jgi:hypothetical protein
VLFKFGGVDKYYVCLFVCFCLYILVSFFLFVAIFLIGHNLHRNCGMHVIGVFNVFEVIGMFNVFEHCLSLEIPVCDSCVGLERPHLFDRYFTCTLA